MPGLCLRAHQEPSTTIDRDLAAMLATLCHHDGYRVESWRGASAHLAMGRVSLGFLDAAPQPVHSADGCHVAMLAGEMFDIAAHRQQLGLNDRDPRQLSHAEILLHGFLAHGEDFLRKVNGIYAAVICDIEQLKLTIISDRFGMKPLYYAHRPGRFTAAAEIKALFVDRDVPRAADDSGMAQFFSFGHLFADNTLFQSVRALPPASILTYDLREDRVSIRGYWDLPGGPSAGAANTKVEAALLEEIDAAFGRAVQRSIDAGDHLGMALSGGLDARSILAAIDCRQTPLKTISMGVPGSLDHLSAARVAQLSGCPHHQYQLDSTVCDSASYRRNLAKVVHLTDGHYLDQVIVMPMLPTIQSLGIRILLRGHAGELMHMHKAYNYSLDEAAWSIRDEAGLEQWLMSRLSGWMLDNVPEPLLCRSSPSEVQDMAKETLRKCLAESAGVVPQLHRIWHLFIRQRLARETSASLAMINSVVETRVPLLDADLIATLLAAPPELKTSEVIQSHILRRRRPEFLRVLNANTGAPVGSPRWRQRAATLKMRVLAKLGVPGYQPYERLGLWLRRELRPLVSDILLVDRCLGRGVFVPETVRSVVQRHWNKQANHTFLIMAMMIHEMGLRQFADGDGQDSTVGRNLAGVS